MEVASPLNFNHTPSGKKRSLGFSPQMVDTPSRGFTEMEMGGDDILERSSKRRRFHADTSIDSLSSAFSSHSPFISHPNTSLVNNTNVHALKLHRSESQNRGVEDLTRTVEEQKSVIVSLKEEKANLESSHSSLRSDHDRVVKENQILRRAVQIQEDRRRQAENQLKEAQEFKSKAEEQFRKMEQVILTLRYHLQTQQHSQIGNDFMGMPPRPPDVF